MLFQRTYLLLIVGLLVFSSCSFSSNEEKIAEWYESTKEEIIDQADEQPDSTFAKVDVNNGLYEQWYFSEEHLIKYEVTDADKKISYTALYAADSNFCLVKEYCKHGNLSYEGIEYKHKPYGTATWYDCETGKVAEQGNRFKFNKIGVWRKYNADGTIKSEVGHLGKIKPNKLPQLDS